MDKATAALASQLLRLTEKVETNARASAVLELATLSFLLDRQWPTLAELETRIQQVRHKLPAEWEDNAVTAALTPLLDVLKDAYGPKRHGWTPRVIEGGLSLPQKDDPDES